jgi:flagellin-like hook-associated protein FlgL
MNGGYTLRSEDLLAHAAEVGRIAGDMRAVAQAGQPLPEGAYGVIGQLFTGQVMTADQSVSASVGGLSRDVTDHEQALHAVLAAYQEHETNTANGFSELNPGDEGSAAGPTAPAGSAAVGGGSGGGGTSSGEPVGMGGEQAEDSAPPTGSISKVLADKFSGGSDSGGSGNGHGRHGSSGEHGGPGHTSSDRDTLEHKQAGVDHRLDELDDREAKLDHEHDRLEHQLDRHDLSHHQREKLEHQLHDVEHQRDVVQHEQHQLRHEAAQPRHESAQPRHQDGVPPLVDHAVADDPGSHGKPVIQPHVPGEPLTPAPPSDTAPDGPVPSDPDTPMISV